MISEGRSLLNGTAGTDPKWRYRCTFLYSNTVAPPAQAGEIAIQTVHTDWDGASAEAAGGRDRADIGRIMIEERMGETVIRGVQERRAEWRGVASWVRHADRPAEWRKG
jgi:hypothetical protein